MKEEDFTACFALTLDQRHSRRGPDRVPALLDALAVPGCLLPAERTAGDEVQLLLGEASAVVAAVERATRLGDWWIGVGTGAVDAPLPASTREARGPAYVAARAAVERAHLSPTGLALDVAAGGAPVGAGTVGGRPYGGPMDETTTLAARAEAALWLQQTLLAHRSAQGWEVCDLLDEGLSVADAAARLGISASAVSQRHARAGREQGLRGRALCTGLLADLQAGVRGRVAA